MSKKIKFYYVDLKYMEYLKSVDSKVSDVSLENKKDKRKFMGILFEINKLKYLAPLSSKKSKFLKMKNSLDFIKINSGEEGAINFNNMIPVFDLYIKEYILEEETDINYKKLVEKQLSWCNKEENKSKILKTATKLYEYMLLDKLPNNIKERCCNFKLLEEKAIEYDKEKYFYLNNYSNVLKL